MNFGLESKREAYSSKGGFAETIGRKKFFHKIKKRKHRFGISPKLEPETEDKMADLHDQINKVRDFHKSFGLPAEDFPVADLSEREFLLRFNLMKEENEEYLEACREGDLNGIADALGDMMYILFGTIVRHGLQDKIEKVFEEIHQSNMSKLDHDGKPIYREDGKVMKGPNYFKPRIEDVLGEKVY